jgi:hypothetical protein
MFSTILSTVFGFVTKNTAVLKYGAIALVLGGLFWYGHGVYKGYKDVQIENETLKGKLVDADKELKNALKVASENTEKVKNMEAQHKKDLEVLNEKHQKDLENNVRTVTVRERIKNEAKVEGMDAPIAPVLRNAIDGLFRKSARTKG